MYIVLMAGGVGSRFWPHSRTMNPKQMLRLFDDRSMLQKTYDRIKPLTSPEKVLIITNMELKEAIAEQLPEIPLENIVGEPFGRNTAPCVGLAGAIIQKRESQDQVMAVLPADHLIQNEENFRSTLQIAADYAKIHNCLITVGIKPTYPETGYGYIQRGPKISGERGKTIYKVKTFAEKPNPDTAKRFLKSGDFLWNSGMFIWSTKLIMDQFAEFEPELSHGFEQIRNAVDTASMDEVISDVYSKFRSISIDYAIMEVAGNVCIMEADFAWNDVGSWEAAYHISEKDEHGNAILADDHCILESENNYISIKDKLVAMVGVNNLVVVETDDAILICDKSKSQNVKDIVDNLKRKKKYQYL